jgi:hypothetical protein
MTYGVAPGLYRIGNPDPNSPVLVTANYKLTVDVVRQSLADKNVWLLVLDTKAVNVWCAAGKGTFGTQELVHRIRLTDLGTVVSHRNLILPQLGATGISAHEVTRETGFRVHYGPVRIQDIGEYLEAGMKATEAMRRVTFGWRERLTVAPIEFVGVLIPTGCILAVLLILHVFRHGTLTPHYMLEIIPFVIAALTGSFVFPLLLPWIPFRAFALKGVLLGIVTSTVLLVVLPMGIMEAIGTTLLVLALVTALALGFTGATTFTTLAGVKLEVRWGMPSILAVASMGAILRVVAAFV